MFVANHAHACAHAQGGAHRSYTYKLHKSRCANTTSPFATHIVANTWSSHVSLSVCICNATSENADANGYARGLTFTHTCICIRQLAPWTSFAHGGKQVYHSLVVYIPFMVPCPALRRRVGLPRSCARSGRGALQLLDLCPLCQVSSMV